MKLNSFTLIFVLFGAESILGQFNTIKKFHLITNTRTTWHKALHYCNSQGWRLAAITSKQDNDQLLSQLSDSGVRDNFWLGATNILNEPFWYWMGTDAPFKFTDWHTGEPNNKLLNEKCIEIRFKDDVFKWNDSPCSRKIYFVCEEKISQLPGGQSLHLSLSDRFGKE